MNVFFFVYVSFLLAINAGISHNNNKKKIGCFRVHYESLWNAFSAYGLWFLCRYRFKGNEKEKEKKNQNSHCNFVYTFNLLFIWRNLLSVFALVTRYTFPCFFSFSHTLPTVQNKIPQHSGLGLPNNFVYLMHIFFKPQMVIIQTGLFTLWPTKFGVCSRPTSVNV